MGRSKNMPDWDDGLDGDDTPTGDEGNKSFKDLRNYSKKLEREQKAALAELEELRGFKAQVIQEKREQTLTNVLQETGLPSYVLNVYKALNPEVEPENINAESIFSFAKDQGIVPAETETPPAAEPKPQGFTPVQVGQPSPLKTYTVEEVQGLIRSGNMDEVNRAYKEGRVEKPSAPWAR